MPSDIELTPMEKESLEHALTEMLILSAKQPGKVRQIMIELCIGLADILDPAAVTRAKDYAAYRVQTATATNESR
jgi:hypothetical protein